MDAFSQLAEAKIQDAIARGDLDDLPGQGRPLELEDLSRMDPSLRAGYLLLKGQGFAPEALSLRKDILRLQDLLAACSHGEGSEESIRSELNRARLRYEVLVGRRADTAALDYEQQLVTARHERRLSGCPDRSSNRSGRR